MYIVAFILDKSLSIYNIINSKSILFCFGTPNTLGYDYLSHIHPWQGCCRRKQVWQESWANVANLALEDHVIFRLCKECLAWGRLDLCKLFLKPVWPFKWSIVANQWNVWAPRITGEKDDCQSWPLFGKNVCLENVREGEILLLTSSSKWNSAPACSQTLQTPSGYLWDCWHQSPLVASPWKWELCPRHGAPCGSGSKLHFGFFPYHPPAVLSCQLWAFAG